MGTLVRREGKGASDMLLAFLLGWGYISQCNEPVNGVSRLW